MLRAVATTVVTSILCMGVILLRKSPDSSWPASSAVISLCVWSVERFLGLLLDSDHGFESENVNFSTWGSFTRVIDYILFITDLSFTHIPSTPQQIIFG